MLVEDLAKLRVCRNRPHPEDGAQVIALDLILKASLKLKEGGILQVEHPETASVAVLQAIGNAGRSASIGDQIHLFAQAFQ